MADLTPYQQKIVQRYYDNLDTLKLQRLSELVGEIYLSEGKKRERLWKRALDALVQLKFPQSRIDHLATQRDPALLASVLQELQNQ
jgi:hypothetical protein